MTRTMLAPMAVVFASGLAMAADDFARLAPPEAGLVVNLADYTRSKELLLATPLGRLIEEPRIAAMIEEARAESMVQFEELAAELGIDVEEWPEPEGMVGFAMVMKPIPEADMWSPQHEQLFVGAVDFGAEGIAEISRIVDAVVEQGLDQGLVEVETIDVGGVELLTITSVMEDEIPEDGEGMDFPEPQTGLRGMLQSMQNITLAISDTTLFVGSDSQMVADALDRARGTDLPSIADDDQFSGAIAQHPDGTSDYLVLFPGRLGLVETFGMSLAFFMPPGVEVADLLTNLGITNMKAISVGADLESTDAQLELSIGVLDTERTGLVSLLDVTGDAWDPPAFMSPDAVSATRLLVDFARLPEVAREFWATLPPEMQDEAGAAFEQAMQFVEPIAPLLGPEVYMVQTISRPFSMETAGVTWVIPTSDELPLNNLLVMGSTSGAFTARDFGGTKVYDATDGSISLSVGYGHFFAGTPESVENALRLAGSGDGESLASDDAFQAAMRPHESTGNALQFTRALDILEYSLWTMQNMAAITRQQLLDDGWTEEELEQYGMNEDTTPEWVKELSIDMFRRGVGDVSMEIAPADDGFRGRILFLEPR